MIVLLAKICAAYHDTIFVPENGFAVTAFDVLIAAKVLTQIKPLHNVDVSNQP